MRLTREKSIRLSHLITDLLVASNDVEFIEDRDTIRQKALQVIQDLLKEEEAMDAEVRKKLNIGSVKADIPEVPATGPAEAKEAVRGRKG
jgi:hypothetical protein